MIRLTHFSPSPSPFPFPSSFPSSFPSPFPYPPVPLPLPPPLPLSHTRIDYKKKYFERNYHISNGKLKVTRKIPQQVSEPRKGKGGEGRGRGGERNPSLPRSPFEDEFPSLERGTGYRLGKREKLPSLYPPSPSLYLWCSSR